jgi:hypothetical protein
MNPQDQKFFGTLLTILTPTVGAIIWFAKTSSRRSERITDKFIEHMQKATEKQELISERHEGALIKVSETMQILTNEVARWRCNASNPAPPKTTRKPK